MFKIFLETVSGPLLKIAADAIKNSTLKPGYKVAAVAALEIVSQYVKPKQ